MSFDIVILCLARECITMVRRSRTFMTSVWLWPLTSISKLYFHWQNVVALWHRHTKFWHIRASLWDNMYVYSWPWYDLDLWPKCGWRGVPWVSFTHSSYLVLTTTPPPLLPSNFSIIVSSMPWSIEEDF